MYNVLVHVDEDMFIVRNTVLCSPGTGYCTDMVLFVIIFDRHFHCADWLESPRVLLAVSQSVSCSFASVCRRKGLGLECVSDHHVVTQAFRTNSPIVQCLRWKGNASS